jgi:hypothetical protein
MSRLIHIAGVLYALAAFAACGASGVKGGGGGGRGKDDTNGYREFVETHRSTFNLLSDADQSQGKELPLHLTMSEAMRVAEAYAEREQLEPFIAGCKAGKYENANEPALPPERGCDLASRSADLLKDYLDRIVEINARGAAGDARASLDQLKQTGCAAHFESFYTITEPGPEQERIARDVQDVYAKAGLEPPAGVGGQDLSKELDEVVAAAIAGSKPSKPAKPEPASHKLIVAHFNQLCKQGSDGQPARNCVAQKAWMTTSTWEIFKNEDDTPRRRTKEAKVLLRLAERDYCVLQHAVVAQEYRGGKYGASQAEVGSGACPVACK